MRLMLVLAKELTAALILDEYYIVGATADLDSLHGAGFVQRAWDIKLDNGHRPYAVLKRHLHFNPDGEAKTKPCLTSFTQTISQLTGLSFAGNVYDVRQTYLFRKSASFWQELWVGFADESGVVPSVNWEDYYAVYRGFVLEEISNIKFVRIV